MQSCKQEMKALNEIDDERILIPLPFQLSNIFFYSQADAGYIGLHNLNSRYISRNVIPAGNYISKLTIETLEQGVIYVQS